MKSRICLFTIVCFIFIGCATVDSSLTNEGALAEGKLYDTALTDGDTKTVIKLFKKYGTTPYCFSVLMGMRMVNDSKECKDSLTKTKNFTLNSRDSKLAETVTKDGKVKPAELLNELNSNFIVQRPMVFLPGVALTMDHMFLEFNLNGFEVFVDTLSKADEKNCKIFGLVRDKKGPCGRSVLSKQEIGKNLLYLQSRVKEISKNREKVLAQKSIAINKMKKNPAYIKCNKTASKMKVLFKRFVELSDETKLAAGNDRQLDRLTKELDDLNDKLFKLKKNIARNKCEKFKGFLEMDPGTSI